MHINRALRHITRSRSTEGNMMFRGEYDVLRGEYEVFFHVSCDSFNQLNIKINMQWNNMICWRGGVLIHPAY